MARIPKLLRLGVKTITIHKGKNPWGGGNADILIHKGSGEFYKTFWEGDIYDETLVHEAVHTSLDNKIRDTEEWKAAVAADGIYVSDYARSYPRREDVAESFVIYLATRCAKDTMTQPELDKWEKQLGNRFRLFDTYFFADDMNVGLPILFIK